MRHRREQLTPEEQRERGGYSSRPQWKQWKEPTGELKLSAHADLSGRYRKTEWEESADAPLETRLGEIVIALEAMAALAAEERVRRAEQERKRREEEHRRYLEQRARQHDEKRWTLFRQMATTWEECDRLRRFIDVLSVETATPAEPSSQVEQRLAWARARLEAMDPLANGVEGVAAEIEAVSQWL